MRETLAIKRKVLSQVQEEAKKLSEREDKFIDRMLNEARQHSKNKSLEMFMARRFDSIMSVENIVLQDLIET